MVHFWLRVLYVNKSSDKRILVWQCITKTCLYNFYPLKPHFYIVKLEFTGVYIIFLILLKNIDCKHSLELPHWGSSNEYPQSMFWAGIWKKYQNFSSENFPFLVVKFSIYLNRRVFLMIKLQIREYWCGNEYPELVFIGNKEKCFVSIPSLSGLMLTLKVPVTAAADTILTWIYLFYFAKEIMFYISCQLSVHMTFHALFFQ